VHTTSTTRGSACSCPGNTITAVTTSIRTLSILAKEIPNRLAASRALFLPLHQEADLDGLTWHQVTTAELDHVDGRPSVIVRFRDGTSDVTLDAPKRVKIAIAEDGPDLPGWEGWLNR
jgi:hypothetical protein